MKRILSIILAAVLVVSAVFAINIKAEENARVKYLQDKKILIGDESGDLKLNDNITRDQFAKLVVYALGKQQVADSLISFKSQFSDMKIGGWANGYVNVASTEKIVNGFPDKTFRPRENVTYEQAIKMMVVTALGHDLSDAEKAQGTSWALPYITKATELGILKHLGTVDYKNNATRNNVFDILYEVLLLKEKKTEISVRGLVTEADDKGGKVLVIKADKEFKVEDEVSFKFAKNLDARNYLGRVCDLVVGPNSEVTTVNVAGEYEIRTGNFEIQRDRLYMNGDKSGYDISASDRTRLDDNLAQILHNNVKYDYNKYLKEVKTVEFAQVTVHDNKVIFIRSYNFKDINPIFDVKDGKVYVIKDNNPDAKSVQPLTAVYRIEKDGLKIINSTEVPTDGVLHIYGNDEAIVTNESLSDVTFRLSKKDGVLNFYVNGKYYPINMTKDKRGVISVDFENYKVIPNDENDSTLRAMETKKNVILLDLNGNVQLVRGNFAEREETMVVSRVSSNEIRLLNSKNESVDVKDSLALEIFDGKKAIRMQDLKEGDLVYVNIKDNNIVRIKRFANSENAKRVNADKNGLLIDTLPSRGRFALVKVDGKEYELTRDTDVIVKEGRNYRFETLDYVKRYASDKALDAVVVTTKEFGMKVPSAATPIAESDQLVKTIVFTNFEENLPVDKEVVVNMEHGFIQGTDNVLTTKNAHGDKKEYKIYRNANIERLDPLDIVRLYLSKDGEVLKAEKLIPYNYREYEVVDYSIKNGITTLGLKRGTEAPFTKTLRRDVTVFGGEVGVGSIVRMHVVNEDIDALVVVK